MRIVKIPMNGLIVVNIRTLRRGFELREQQDSITPAMRQAQVQNVDNKRTKDVVERDNKNGFNKTHPDS